MSKRKRLNKTELKLKKGYGTGVGKDYKSWITIQDVASEGRSTRQRGILNDRQYDFLSDMERNYFLIVSFSELILDIREQYALQPIEETILIAEELGIKHPKNHKTEEYVVITTDFLITLNDGDEQKVVARTIKSKDELLKKRVLEKFEIEREFFNRRKIDWGIVTEDEIDKTLASNINYIYNYKDISDREGIINMDENVLNDLIIEYIKRLLNEDKSVRLISNLFERDYGLVNGTGLTIFKYLIINKYIEIDLYSEFNFDEILHIDINIDSLKEELGVL